MSIDEALLNEFYESNEGDSDEMIKEAQAELIESVADEAGVDLDSLTDDELDKFAEYVLTPEGASEHLDPNLATADAMGRQMAHSFIDEQEKLAHYEGDVMYDYEDTLLEKAAEWEFFKEAKKKKDPSFTDRMRGYGSRGLAGAKRLSGFDDISRARQIGKALGDYKGDMAATGRLGQGSMSGKAEAAMRRQLLKSDNKAIQKMLGRKGGAVTARDLKTLQSGLYTRGGARAAALTAGAGGLGYLAMREKKSSYEAYDPSVAWIEDLEGVEFAKLAEYRAAEILAANGVDPETFEAIYPEHIKVANFPEPEDAEDWESAEDIQDYNDILDEAALDIIEDLGLL